jgi:2-methylcitrate dehydratase
MLSVFRRVPRSFNRSINASISYRSSLGIPSSLILRAAARAMSVHHGESAVRPEPDKVLKDIADYVHNYQVTSDLAFETARLCLIDTIGCGLEGLNFPECTKLLGPVVEGTVVPNGATS